MPIQGRVTAGQEEFLTNQSGAHRVAGPSREIGNASPWLAGRVRSEVMPLLQKIRVAADSGKEIPAPAQHALEMVNDALQKGGEIDARNVASLYVLTQSALGDGTAAGIGVGGLNDPESPFYVSDATARAELSKRLSDLQGDMAYHLTRDRNVFHWMVHKLHIGSLEVPWRQQVREEAKKQLKWAQEEKLIRNDLARQLEGSDYASITDLEKRRKIQGLTMDELWKRIGSNRAREILRPLAAENAPATDLLTDAETRGQPEAKRIAQLAKTDPLTKTFDKFIKQSDRIRGMQTMEDFYRMLGLNYSSPDELRALPIPFLLQSIGDHYKLKPADIAALQADPNKAVTDYLRQDPIGLTVFVSELYRNRLQGLQVERNQPSIPDQLKKQPNELRLSADGKKALTSVEASVQLLLSIGDTGKDFVDLVRDVESSLKITNAEADALLQKADMDGYLEVDGSTGKRKANKKLLMQHAPNEHLAILAHRGRINRTEIEAQKKIEIAARTGLTGLALDSELATQMANFDELYTALDRTKPIHQRATATQKWDKLSTAFLFMNTTGAIMNGLVESMDDGQRQQVAGLFEA